MLASLNDQTVFKKLLREPDILQAFVKDLIGIDIAVTAESIEVEKKFVPVIGGVDITIDVFAQDPTHRLVIEVQRRRYDDNFDRFWYYHQAATLEQITSYKDYTPPRTVYTIVWFTHRTDTKAYQEALITTALCSETNTGKKLPIYPHKLFFLNPFYVNDTISPALADWMMLVSESVNNPENPQLNQERDIIQKAAQIIAEDGLTPQERADIIDERAYERYLAKTRKEGHEEGWKAGLEKGREEGMLKTAHTMLAKGYALAEVTELTGIPVEKLSK